MAPLGVALLATIALIGSVVSQQSYDVCEITTTVGTTETQTSTFIFTSTLNTTSTLYETVSVPPPSPNSTLGRPYHYQTSNVNSSLIAVLTQAPQPVHNITTTVNQALPSSEHVTHTYTVTSTLTNTVTETVTKHMQTLQTTSIGQCPVISAEITTVHQTITIYQTLTYELSEVSATNHKPQPYGFPASQSLDHKPITSYSSRPTANPGYGGQSYHLGTIRPHTRRPYRPSRLTRIGTVNHYSIVYGSKSVNTFSAFPSSGSSVAAVSIFASLSQPSAYSPLPTAASGGEYHSSHTSKSKESTFETEWHPRVSPHPSETTSMTNTGGRPHATHGSATESDQSRRTTGESRHHTREGPTFSYTPPIVYMSSKTQPDLTLTAYGPPQSYSPPAYPVPASSEMPPSSVTFTGSLSHPIRSSSSISRPQGSSGNGPGYLTSGFPSKTELHSQQGASMISYQPPVYASSVTSSSPLLFRTQQPPQYPPPSDTILTPLYSMFTWRTSEKLSPYEISTQGQSHGSKPTPEPSTSHQAISNTSYIVKPPRLQGTSVASSRYEVDASSKQSPPAYQPSSASLGIPQDHAHTTHLASASMQVTSATLCESEEDLQPTGYKAPPYCAPLVSGRPNYSSDTDVPAYAGNPALHHGKSDSKLKPRGNPHKSMDAGYASQKPAVCGMPGNFTVHWDDEPVPAISNPPTLPFSPAFNPYHHMLFSNGYTYAPQAADKLYPISSPCVAMFKGETPGEISAGPRASMRAFWFNALSTYLACDNEGLDYCDLIIKGYSYDMESETEVQVAEQTALLPPCNKPQNCQLTKVEFQWSFEGLSAITIAAAINGSPTAFYVDDLALEWWDTSCGAGLERSRAQK